MSDSSITINGNPVLVDIYSEIQAFLDRYLPVEDWLFTRHELPEAYADPEARAEDSIWCESPYPKLPACKINQLIWPTGASRYGRALFLVDKPTLLRIAKDAWRYEPSQPPNDIPEEEISSYPQNEYLRVAFYGDQTKGIQKPIEESPGAYETDNTTHKFEADMYALSPLRIPGTGMDLFVLPMVDRRYFERAKLVQVTNTRNYRFMIKQVARSAQLPARMSAVSSVYDIPDVMFQETTWPACKFIDVMALSVGQRVVYHPLEQQATASDEPGEDTKYRLDIQNVALAKSNRLLNLDNSLQIAGGRYWVTSQIQKVRLKHWRQGQRTEKAIDLAKNSNDNSQLEICVWSGWDNTYMDEEGDAGATNLYIEAFTESLLGWAQSGGMYCFQGPINYKPSGFDDYYSIEILKVGDDQVFRSVINELPPIVLPKVCLPNAGGGLYRYKMKEAWSASDMPDCQKARCEIRSIGGSEVVLKRKGTDDAAPTGLPYVHDVFETHADMGINDVGIAVKNGRWLYTIDTPCT